MTKAETPLPRGSIHQASRNRQLAVTPAPNAGHQERTEGRRQARRTRSEDHPLFTNNWGERDPEALELSRNRAGASAQVRARTWPCPSRTASPRLGGLPPSGASPGFGAK